MPLTTKSLGAFPVSALSKIADYMRGLMVTRSIYQYSRVIPALYIGTPLAASPNPSRFSLAPGKRPKKTTSIIYGAKFLSTGIYETVIRDRFDLQEKSKRIIMPLDYRSRGAVWFSSKESLNLLDLSNGEPSFFGVPSDVIKSSEHSHGQYFSRFIYDQMDDVHGFIYSSRFTETECVALFYDRTIKLLMVDDRFKLNKPLLTHELARMSIDVR